MTHVLETGARKMESMYGAGFWSVCHGYSRPFRLGFSTNTLNIVFRCYLLSFDV